MLKIQNLTAGYETAPDVLKSVSLELHEREIVTVIGPNGAGKSTLLNSVFGLTDVRAGEIFHDAREITNLKTAEILKSGIALVAQRGNVFLKMTVAENLACAAWSLRDRTEISRKIEEVFSFFPTLKKMQKKTATLLSGGERQMVAIGMALMLSPEILLLDEPSIGLAPKIAHDVFEKIQKIRDAGTAILIVEQNAVAALEISDRGYVLDLGENAIEGTGENLLKNPEVGKLFLGHAEKN
ncbi:ABC transporter ATP-binding protein [bacterium]|jgi:ABC-type branched-subunit amino acid transport system ATPase component|nr:ABC transporter ATP-binding protein [bacterium]MBT6996160.1 ABC transporter ATP-binding protein [bacterium]MBT7772543.1 ABC transporter ATP-binding protein [bacterium]